MVDGRWLAVVIRYGGFGLWSMAFTLAESSTLDLVDNNRDGWLADDTMAAVVIRSGLFWVWSVALVLAESSTRELVEGGGWLADDATVVVIIS